MTGEGHTTRFRWLLLGCCVVGLAVRLGLGWHTSTDHLGSDTPFFRDGAAELVDSGRYTGQRGSEALSTTAHPPAFVLVLAAGEVVGERRFLGLLSASAYTVFVLRLKRPATA